MPLVAHAEAGQTTVQYVGEGRAQERLDAFWEGLMPEQLAGVEALAMDLWKPYVQSTLAQVPGAAGKIVPDPFHLVKDMNAAVTEVRQSEPRRLQAQGDDLLKRPRQLWLYGMEPNMPSALMPSRSLTWKPHERGRSRKCFGASGGALR